MKKTLSFLLILSLLGVSACRTRVIDHSTTTKPYYLPNSTVPIYWKETHCQLMDNNVEVDQDGHQINLRLDKVGYKSPDKTGQYYYNAEVHWTRPGVLKWALTPKNSKLLFFLDQKDKVELVTKTGGFIVCPSKGNCYERIIYSPATPDKVIRLSQSSAGTFTFHAYKTKLTGKFNAANAEKVKYFLKRCM